MQVAGDLRVAADDLVHERVGQEDVERLDEVVAGGRELVEHRLQLAQRVDRGDLGRLDHPDADVAELVEGLEHPDQVVTLGVDARQRARQLLERLVDVALLLARGDREPVEGLDRVDDLRLVGVEGPGEGVDLGEHRADVVLAAGDRLVELLGDGLELRHAAAVEDQAQRAEHLLDLRVAAAPLERDDLAVGERALRPGLGRRERDELLAEQAGLADLGDRVLGQLGVVAQLEGDVRRGSPRARSP